VSARTKLNVAYTSGALFFAAIIGGMFQSWALFVVVAIVLVAMAVHSGSIRRSR